MGAHELATLATLCKRPHTPPPPNEGPPRMPAACNPMCDIPMKWAECNSEHADDTRHELAKENDECMRVLHAWRTIDNATDPCEQRIMSRRGDFVVTRGLRPDTTDKNKHCRPSASCRTKHACKQLAVSPQRCRPKHVRQCRPPSVGERGRTTQDTPCMSDRRRHHRGIRSSRWAGAKTARISSAM